MLGVRIWVESFRCAAILLLQWQDENIPHRQHLKFGHFQPVHSARKILYLQSYSTDFRNLCLSSKMLVARIWVESFRCAAVLLLQWQGENFPHRQHLKFATFNLYTVPEKILYLLRYSTDFRNLCLSSMMLRVGIWAESFRCAGILLLQWQGENLAHGQHLKFCHFQPEQCASKNPISRKVFNRFSKSSPQLEDDEGGHLGGKFQAPRYFTFAMARWKLCASTTFEIFHFQPVPCTNKNPVSPKLFNRFSKSLPQLEDVEGGHLCVRFQVRRYFIFAMARWKLCALTAFEILPLSTCTLSQLNPISPKVFNRFSKSLPQLEDVEEWAFGHKVSSAQVFYFNNGKVKILRIVNIWNFATFNLYTVPTKSYISKCIQPIFEIFASGRRFWGWAFGWKVLGAQIFYFCNGKVKTLRMDNIWNFATSTCTMCRQKSYISKGIQPIFEIFASARRCWGWAFGWKVSCSQVFCFCHSNVKTLRMDSIWNFATFNRNNVPTKILYLERYSTDFRNLCLSSKMLRVSICV